MDPVKIKPSIIKKCLKILSVNQNLTPDNVIKYSEGAAILLTWIINLIKWNAGFKLFQFDESQLGGEKDLNQQLVPLEKVDESTGDLHEDQRHFVHRKEIEDDTLLSAIPHHNESANVVLNPVKKSKPQKKGI